MGFGIDYNNTSTNGIISIGEYEVIIKAAFEDTTKNGATFINVPLVIRNDIEQSHKNVHVWHSIWKRKEPTAADLACGGYSAAQINLLSKKVGIPNEKKFESLEQWLSELKGRILKIKVKHEEYPANSGKMQAKVDSMELSRVPDCKHVFKTKQTDDVYYSVETVDDEEGLPF